MKYFRLHFFVHYASGDNGGCLYNMHSKKMIYITKENDVVLQKAENNEEIDENNLFLKELYDKNMGAFYDSKVVVEKTRLGVPKEYDSVATPKTIVNHAFIQVTNDCNGDCAFCNSSEKVYTKTRCKKWENRDAGLDVEKWKNIFAELKNLRCNQITFIGGDPMLAFERICTYVALAKEAGIYDFEIYTNLNHVTEQQMSYIAEQHIAINAQIIELKDNSLYTKIVRNNVLKNIESLLNLGVKVKASILITRYNDTDIKSMVEELREIGIQWIMTDFFYENTDNSHFSEKYKKEMYTKQFIEVNRENFAFLDKNNNCLYGKVSINLAGDVTPCPMLNDFICGNVYEDKLNHILSETKYSDLTKLTREKTENCSSCAFRMNCIDCRALEIHATGRLDGVKYCEISQQIKKNA